MDIFDVVIPLSTTGSVKFREAANLLMRVYVLSVH